MPRNNLSLRGMRDYALTKNGVPNTSPPYSCLRDLEQLVFKMDAIRNGGSTEGCANHGKQVPSQYGENKTNCSHSLIYSPLSLGQIRVAIDGMKACSCDSFEKWYCDCHSNKVMCDCDSYG